MFVVYISQSENELGEISLIHSQEEADTIVNSMRDSYFILCKEIQDESFYIELCKPIKQNKTEQIKLQRKIQETNQEINNWIKFNLS